MMHYGQLDEDTPVSIPYVPTNFIMQPVSQKSPHHDTTSGLPPLPSERYKKHPSDPSRTRNSPQLSPLSSSSSLNRSKSCGEGRSSEPSDALDVLSKKTITQRLGSEAHLHDPAGHHRENSDFEPPKPSTADFKCNVFCVSLPVRPNKKKSMQVRSESHLSSNSVESENVSKNNTFKHDPEFDAARPSVIVDAARPSVISKVASLERFDLSSLSSDIVLDYWNERRGSSYFDLPMELISSSEDDPDLPVNSTFLFENDRKSGRYKKKSSSSRTAFSKTSSEMSSWRSSNSRTSSSSKISDASSIRSSLSSACLRPKISMGREELESLVEGQST